MCVCGYPHGKRGWKLYDLVTGEIFVSRDVQFHENEFPFMDARNLDSVAHDNQAEPQVR